MVKYLKFEDCMPGDELRDKDGYFYKLTEDAIAFRRFYIKHGLHFINSDNPHWNTFIPKGRVDELCLLYDHRYFNKKKLDKELEELLK